MPIILQIDYEDGTSEELRIPAEIWRLNNEKVAKLLIADQPITSITVDPHLETADIDLSDNKWPPEPIESRFKLFKDRERPNPMQQLEGKIGNDAELNDEEDDARRRR